MSASTVYYPDDEDRVWTRSYVHGGEAWVVLYVPGLQINANGPDRIARLRKIAEQLMLACDAVEEASTDVDHAITDSALEPAVSS